MHIAKKIVNPYKTLITVFVRDNVASPYLYEFSRKGQFALVDASLASAIIDIEIANHCLESWKNSG